MIYIHSQKLIFGRRCGKLSFHEVPSILNPQGKLVAKKHRESNLKSQLSSTLRLPLSTIKPTSITEHGIHFSTSHPVTFKYIRNPVKSVKHPDPDRFGQNLEPNGRYMNHSDGFIPEGWEHGTITFTDPLVIEWGTTSSDPKGWKYRLSQHFGGRTGKNLSRRIAKEGYDGIVTVDRDHTSEIVDLTMY